MISKDKWEDVKHRRWYICYKKILCKLITLQNKISQTKRQKEAECDKITGRGANKERQTSGIEGILTTKDDFDSQLW